MSSGSVVRNQRRATSSRQSSPYSRPPPAPKKVKIWPWDGLVSILQPLADQLLAAVSPRAEEICEYEELPSEIEIENGLQPTPIFEPPVQQELRTPPSRTPPQQASTAEPAFSPFSIAGNPMKARDQVAEFLHRKEKSGTPLNEMEVAGIMSLLKKDAEETYEPEAFRFSNSPSTPAQSPQPVISPTIHTSPSSNIFGQSRLPTFTNNVSNSNGAPRKFLTRNPNGEYKWTGGGSARAVTPASRRGSPYRTRQPPSAKSDTKRRRVGEEREEPGAERSGHPQAAPSTNEFSLNAIQRAPAHILRPTLRPKTTPVVPSPLRQVVNGASPPGSPPAVPGAAPVAQISRASRAAAVLSEIIEQATAPPKPDVSNPYQTASPVKPILKPRDKRRQPERRSKEKVTEKQKEASKVTEVPSPVAVIGATLPKGAKRSRPPPGLSKSSSPSKTNGSEYRLFGGEPQLNGRGSGLESQQSVEEVEEEQRPSPSKKQRSVSIEEVEDEETNVYETITYTTPSEVIEPTEQAGTPKIATNSSFGASKTSSGLFGSPSPTSPTEATNEATPTSPSIFGASASASAKAASAFSSLKSSAPKEPSKLRASFVAEEEEGAEETFKKPIFPSITAQPSSTNTFSSTFPAPPAKNSFSSPFNKPLNGLVPEVPSFSKPVKAQKSDPKEIAMDADDKDLPKFPFVLTRTVSLADNAEARAAASVLPVTSLPTFDFSKPVPTKFSEKAPAGGVPAASSKGFNWTAAGMKAPTAKADTEWQCSVCMLKNPASATAKCTICEAPRPASQSIAASPLAPIESAKPVVKAFDWSAAGIAPPPKSSESWKCSVCFLDNPATATEKCTVCESPRR